MKTPLVLCLALMSAALGCSSPADPTPRAAVAASRTLGAGDVFAMTPSTRIAIDGVDTSAVTFSSFELATRGDGFLQGTIDGAGLRDALAGALLGDGEVVRTRPLRLHLSDSARTPLLVLVAVLIPIQTGSGFDVMAVREPRVLCDPGSLRSTLETLLSEKATLLSEIDHLEAAIEGLQIADATERQQTVLPLLDALIAEAWATGDLGEAAQLTAMRASLAQTTANDQKYEFELEKLLQSTTSELASVDLAIRDVITELEVCQGETY